MKYTLFAGRFIRHLTSLNVHVPRAVPNCLRVMLRNGDLAGATNAVIESMAQEQSTSAHPLSLFPPNMREIWEEYNNRSRSSTPPSPLTPPYAPAVAPHRHADLSEDVDRTRTYFHDQWQNTMRENRDLLGRVLALQNTNFDLRSASGADTLLRCDLKVSIDEHKTLARTHNGQIAEVKFF